MRICWPLVAPGALSTGLLSGADSRNELERAGAYRVYRDPAGVLAHVDELGQRHLEQTADRVRRLRLARCRLPRRPGASARSPLESLATRVDGELIPAFAAHGAALTDGDVARLDSAAAAFERMGAVLYAAEASAEAAHLHRRASRTGSALTSARRGRRLSDQCEAAARTPPALADLDGSLPLTCREREIARLAAGGLTNRQIADRLVVSMRTVDNHLHTVYSKLDTAPRSGRALRRARLF